MIRFIAAIFFALLMTSFSAIGQGSNRIFGSIVTHGYVDSSFIDMPVAITVFFKGDSVWRALKISKTDTFSLSKLYFHKPVARLGFSKPGYDTVSIALNDTVSKQLPRIDMYSVWNNVVANVYISHDTVWVEKIESKLPFIDNAALNFLLPGLNDDGPEGCDIASFYFNFEYPEIDGIHKEMRDYLLKNSNYLGTVEYINFRIDDARIRTLEGQTSIQIKEVRHKLSYMLYNLPINPGLIRSDYIHPNLFKSVIYRIKFIKI
ncbi:hypothetical protein GC194_13195 [bacterium]|nr:hypothetical protein [bacterium]